MSIQWENIKIKLGELIPWAENPRQITNEQAKRLDQSLEDYGQVEVFAISPRNEVYDGHQRLSVLLRKYGMDYEIDARRSSRELTDEERRKLVLYLHGGASGQWNWDLLSDWDSKLLLESGFDNGMLKQLSADLGGLNALLESEKQVVDEGNVGELIDRAGELQKKWRVKRGDIWEIPSKSNVGKAHRIMCGDSTSAEDMAKLMQGEKSVLCFTSPPYNAGVSAQLSENTSIDDNFYKKEYDDNQSSEKYLQLLFGFTELALMNAEYVFVNLQMLSGNKTAVIDYLTKFKNFFSDVAIWDKGHAAPALAQRVMDSRFEFVLMFSQKGTRQVGTREFRGMVHNVYSGSPQRHNEFADVHAATFPVEFPRHFIETFTNPGELIFDPFIGSGTTIVACEDIRRVVRAMDISSLYCSVVLERLSALGLEPKLIVRNGVHTRSS